MEEPEECIFSAYYGTNCIGSQLSENRDNKRVESIIEASKTRKDTLHDKLTPLLEADPKLKVKFHYSCISKYCSTKSVIKVKPPEKRKRRSEEPNFNLLTDCLYCGEKCNVTRDPKHPDRWRQSFLLLKTQYYCKVRRKDIEYKKYLEEKCYQRSDELGDQVLFRLSAVQNDIVAADGRYHKDCKMKFHLRTNDDDESLKEIDHGFLKVIRNVKADRTKIWTSAELYKLYLDDNDNVLYERKYFISKLLSYFGGDLLTFTNRGYLSWIVFKDNALVVMKDAKDKDKENLAAGIGNIIAKECRDIKLNKDTYTTHIDLDIAMDNMSSTLQYILEDISPLFCNSLFTALIGCMVTSVVQNKPTQLQLALGIMLRHSKSILSHLHKYRVTCSYDEVLRFKKSAALNSSKGGWVNGVPKNNSLLQVISDNFDAEISSQNGKSQTHCLATILTRTPNDNEDEVRTTFRRVKKEEMSEPIPDAFEAELSIYNGPKKPQMVLPKQNLPEDFSNMQKISRARGELIDFNFFLDMVSKATCPEYNGYCSRVNNDDGLSIRHQTKIIYIPLLDMVPAEATTMQTSMVQAKRLSVEHGQSFCVYTSDQQLYCIAAKILWNTPDLFKDFYLRLGGMHFLMSFIGSIGTLMAGTGMKEILDKAFGGVPKMLVGKKYPQNLRALRMLVEELLRPLLKDGKIDSHSKLMSVLEEKSNSSRTTKLWVDVLIKPIFLCLLFVRAEREGDWPLHLEAVQNMIPLFFAAGHVNYARWGLYYLRSMEALPEDVQYHFLKGEHTIQLSDAVWAGVWSDMGIEVSYMRFGKGVAGIIGQSTNMETVKVWAYSLNACCEVVECLEAMENKSPSPDNAHKEEKKSRILKDGVDRNVLRKRLDVSIDVFDASQHGDGLVNIVTGKIVNRPDVNVDDSVRIGEAHMEEFSKKLPNGFYETISKKIKTMADINKGVKSGNKIILDPEIIYARALAMMHINPDFDFEKLLVYELAPHPTSIFDEEGKMRSAKQKSKLMTTVKVEVSARTLHDVDSIFLDGCAILWVVPWPSKGTIASFVVNFRKYVIEKLNIADVYLIFDRYYIDSIKGLTRFYRDSGASRVYQLTADAPIPSREVVLKVSKNKEQLIQLIVDDLIANARSMYPKKLTLTGKDPVPLQIFNGNVSSCENLRTTHEEADTIVIHQLVVSSTKKAIVIADDTDIFVLLLHFKFTGDIQSEVYMQPTDKDSSSQVIDINATYQRHYKIIPNILAAHALSGCDTVGPCFGIGKKTVINVLTKKDVNLSSIGFLDETLENCVKQGTNFLLHCYGQSKVQTLNDARKKMWKQSISKNKSAAPKLESLPPTDEAFIQNLKRGHLQVAVWRCSLNVNPPQVRVHHYGWGEEEGTKYLIPLPVDEEVTLIPDEILKIFRCGCSSENSCKSGNCSCNKSRLPCSTFCECEGGVSCINPFNVAARQDTNEDVGATEE